MLDVSPGNLSKEIQAAVVQRDLHLMHYHRQVRRYHGNHYRGPAKIGEHYRENHYHDWMSMIVPLLAFYNPAWNVGSYRGGGAELVTSGLHWGMNRWTELLRLGEIVETGPAVDMQFNHGVCIVTNEPVSGARPIMHVGGFGQEGVPHMPMVYRVSQRRYVEDSLSTDRREIRFKAHKWTRDRNSLIEEAKANPELGWDLKALQDASVDTGLQDLGRPEEPDVVRGEISGWDIWIPEIQLPGARREDGFNGTWFTISDRTGGGNARYLRKARPWFGHPDGPYVVFGTYTVPDNPQFLSPLVVIEEEISDLNAHAGSMARSAADFKKLVFVNEAKPKLQQDVTTGQHHYVFPARNLKREDITEVSIGGVDPGQVQYYEIARDRLARHSGLHDQHNAVTGKATATENEIVSANTSNRIGYIQKRFMQGVRQIGERALWFMWKDNRVAIPLGSRAAQEMGYQGAPIQGPDGQVYTVPEDLWFHGGDESMESMMSFNDLELSIEPFSMERVPDGIVQARLAQLDALVLEVAPMIPQMPWVNWKEYLSRRGDALNIPNLGDLIDIEAALQFAGVDPSMAGEDPRASQARLVGPGPQQQHRMTYLRGGRMGRVGGGGSVPRGSSFPTQRNVNLDGGTPVGVGIGA